MLIDEIYLKPFYSPTSSLSQWVTQKLLTDSYGRWDSIPRRMLEDLVERIISEVNHSEETERYLIEPLPWNHDGYTTPSWSLRP